MTDEDLDRLLARVPPPAAPRALEQRILGDFDRLSRRWTIARLADRLAELVWPGGPAWQPACALALALAIGLGAAIFAPLEAGAADEASTAFAFDVTPDAPQDI